jgi:diketogulonate reductase-like aldo/keto reductase
LAKFYVSTILLGASKTAQLEDNLGAADLKLSAEEVAELDQATAPMPIYPNWFHEKTLDVTASDALRKGLPAQPAEVKV